MTADTPTLTADVWVRFAAIRDATGRLPVPATIRAEGAPNN